MNEPVPATIARRPFEGVEKILRYNWPQYLVGLTVVVIAAVAALVLPIPLWARWVLVGGASLASWWLFASLAASHWVYDRSALYQWKWLNATGEQESLRWVNVHAGLDESTSALANALQRRPVAVLDIFDPEEMSEPSIARARNSATEAWPAISCIDGLPESVRDIDWIFAIFCLHEIRHDRRRIERLTECASRLRPDGRIVVVEHLRDFANFAVFGAGFAHFLSRRTWLRSFQGAGLSVASERRVTPFVRIFELQKAV